VLIDWFTVGAQAVNFLILMWLLKRFLYKPVLDAIDGREQRLLRQMQNMQAAQAAAAQERDEFERKNAEFEQQHAGLLEQATAEAQAARQQLLEAARAEAAALRAQWQEALDREQQRLSRGIATRTRQEVFAITRKTLTDLADTGLEARMVAVFIRRLQALGMVEKVQMCTPAGQKDCQVLIRSAFLLPPTEQAALTQTVQSMLPIQPNIRFETEPELLSGIELISNGHKLEWSIADYLTALEASIGDLLHTLTPPAAPTAPHPEPAHV
jgi:F-type H+-transporting ATPase subunit b